MPRRRLRVARSSLARVLGSAFSETCADLVSSSPSAKGFHYTIQHFKDQVRAKRGRIYAVSAPETKGPQDYLTEMELYGAIACLLLGGAALGLVASLRRSRRDAQKLADRKRNRLIKERLSEAPSPATPVRRREITVRFPEHADQ